MRPTARAVALLALLLSGAAVAQDQPPPSLRLDGLTPGGVRPSATEAWGMFDLILTNISNRDRLARVVFFYEGQDDLQYGRDVWVPARSRLNSWMLGGPAAARGKAGRDNRSIGILLYERTDGAEAWVRPRSEERFRTGGFFYRKRDTNDPYLAVVLDPEPETPHASEVPQPPPYTDEVKGLLRSLRASLNTTTPHVRFLESKSLPAVAEAYAGIDQLVIASGQVAQNQAGLRAARHWLMRGGTAWVLLDRLDPEAVAPLLGGAMDFHIVDRPSLTTFRVEVRHGPRSEPEQAHEQAVDFARVLLPAGEEPRFTIDGWPVWFVRRVGRGKVIFSTLGPRGWTRPRRSGERAAFDSMPDLPMARPHLDAMALQFEPPRNDLSRPDALEEALSLTLPDEIGYSVVGRGAAAAVFGVFLAGALTLVVLARGPRWREWLGWLVPAAALAAAAVFVLLGERSRRSAAATVATGQVVDVVPGVEEASVQGVIASYRPEGGPAELGAERGGLYTPDLAGTEGQTRRFITSDLGQWHWEGLSLPAGVRQGPFRHLARTEEPLRAVATFGPDGLEGRLSAGPFRDVSDAVLLSLGPAPLPPAEWPGLRPMAIDLAEGGAFRATSRDALPEGSYLAGALLTDRQQRRQDLYRRLLKTQRHLYGRPVLLAWADPIDTGFHLLPDARRAGDALLAIPLEYRLPEAGARLTVPGPLVSFQRLRDGLRNRATLEGSDGVEQRLRFQLPAAALPLQVQRVRLRAWIEGPSRRVIVSARDGGAFTEVYNAEASPDPIRVDVDRPGLLALDAEGGLQLNVRVTDLPPSKEKPGRDRPEARWKIHYLELEVTGTRR